MKSRKKQAEKGPLNLVTFLQGAVCVEKRERKTSGVKKTNQRMDK